ncbi:MAG: acyltransferase [Eubacterium sp.]
MAPLETGISKSRASNRIYYLDALRVIACLAVVMIHSSSQYVAKDFGSLNFWVANICDGLSRIGVPLFVMISGAVMLDENYGYTAKKLINHIKKMVVFFVFWSGIYCIIFQIIDKIINHKAIRISDIMGSFVRGHFHLWYVYLIIGLYLIVPLLRLWVKKENKKYVEYFIVLSVIFTFLVPQIISVCSNFTNILEPLSVIMENKLYLEYVGGYTTYFLLGWYIHNYDVKNKNVIYILGIISLIVTVFGTYALSVANGKSLPLYDYLYLNILLQAVTTFQFVKSRLIHIKRDNKFVNIISKNSLGIYAIHIAVITALQKVTEMIGIDSAIIRIPLVFLLTFVISTLTTYILSKIPFLKKFV